MFTLEIDPLVLEKLRRAFPKPANCADRALEKYRVLLEEMLLNAVRRGRSAYELRFDLYSIPVSVLTYKGPQLNAGKQRLHAWLKENKLELVEAVEVGTNLSGLVSVVKLTDLVTFKDNIGSIKEKLLVASTPDQVSAILSNDNRENMKIFCSLFPDYFCYFGDQRSQMFDIAPIDIESLEAYIVWLNTKATKFNAASVETQTRQAMLIHSVAEYTDGWFPMRKKRSDFGRTYYEGISVQNVNKTLRRAILGNCWEYDIRAAVITWKLTYAEELARQREPGKNWRGVFWASLLYVEGRKEFMHDVRSATFGQDSGLTIEKQEALIKEAITAIGFGARANGNGWREKDGTWGKPALVNMSWTHDERVRFLSCPAIKQFVGEQTLLDEYLEEGMKNHLPKIYWSPLITEKIRPSRSKAVAYLYQKQETEAMNVARGVLARYGITPIANIHDAFIVKHKLPVDIKHEIICEMRSQMGNELFTINADKLDGFVLHGAKTKD